MGKVSLKPKMRIEDMSNVKMDERLPNERQYGN
jgi:hypothetical protein